MSPEGFGGRDLNWQVPHRSEDPFQRGIEASGSRGIEDNEAIDGSSWLSSLINKERLDRIRQYPASEGNSDEWLIYQLFLGILVEAGPELDPVVRARLRNLVGTMRVAMFSNLNPAEQDSLMRLSRATTFDMSSVEYTIDDEAIDDIRWLWGTFGLRVPAPDEGQPSLGDIQTALFGPIPGSSE